MRKSFVNVLIFLVINVPLTLVLSLLLATALNAAIRGRTFLRVSYYIPYITASVAVVAVWLFLFSSNGMVNQVLGPLAPDPSWLVNSKLAMPLIALFVTWKQLGLLHPALPRGAAERAQGALRVGGGGRRGQVPDADQHHDPRRPARDALVVILSTITGANLFTEPYLLTNGGGPNGASTSPVFVMYQRGIEQGNPDVASAIGVVLVIGVLLIALHQQAPAGKTLTWHEPVHQPPPSTRVLPPSRTPPSVSAARGAGRGVVLLFLGAIVFLFPFYYMLIGSLQKRAGHVAERALSRPATSAWTTTARSTPGRPGAVAAQLRHLHRRRAALHRRLRGAGRLRAGPPALPGSAARSSSAMLLVQVVPVPAADHPAVRA